MVVVGVVSLEGVGFDADGGGLDAVVVEEDDIGKESKKSARA